MSHATRAICTCTWVADRSSARGSAGMRGTWHAHVACVARGMRMLHAWHMACACCMRGTWHAHIHGDAMRTICWYTPEPMPQTTDATNVTLMQMAPATVCKKAREGHERRREKAREGHERTASRSAGARWVARRVAWRVERRGQAGLCQLRCGRVGRVGDEHTGQGQAERRGSYLRVLVR